MYKIGFVTLLITMFPSLWRSSSG